MRFDMFESGASDTPPSPPVNPSIGYPSNGNAEQGIQPTVPGAYFFYALAEELKNMVLAAGLTPDASKTNQVAEALAKFKLFADDYLLKTGGTMTGVITFNANANAIRQSDTTHNITITSGTSYNDSPSLTLFGSDGSDANVAGQFTLRAGKETKGLVGKPSGLLAWGGINISAMGMPENVYTNITIPASNGTVTAPADGWFVMEMQASAVGQYIYMDVTNGIRNRQVSGTSNAYLSMFLPVKKGDVVKCVYTATANKFLQFLYAKGSAWEKS